MPLTQVDEVAAFVVIDLQNGLRGWPMAHPMGDIVARTAVLADAFRERSLPVVLVNVIGRAPGRTESPGVNFPSSPDFAELVPELTPQAGDAVVTKQRMGAFLGTALDGILRGRGVTQVFLAGVATSRGVEATAYSAYDLGYNVVLVADAITDRDADAHRYCLEKVFPRIGEVETTEGVLAMLQS